MAIPVADVRRLFSSFKSKAGKVDACGHNICQLFPFPTSWYLVLLGWKPNPHVGLATFCDASTFCMNPPRAGTRHCEELSVDYLTALFRDFLNSDHKECCVPKQVWHHEWGFSLLQSESPPIIQLISLLAKSGVGTLRFPKIITGFFFFLLVLSTNTLSHSVGQSIYLLICTQQAYFNLFSNSISLPWDDLLYVVHGRNLIVISIINIMKECKWEKSVGHTQGRIIMSPQSFFQDVFIISIAISFQTQMYMACSHTLRLILRI